MCGFLYVNVARRNCPVTLHCVTLLRERALLRLAFATNLATPTTRKNLQARSVRKCKNVRHEFIRERTFLYLRRMRSICRFDAVSFGWNHPNPTKEPHEMCGFLYVNVARRNCPVTLHCVTLLRERALLSRDAALRYAITRASLTIQGSRSRPQLRRAKH